MSANDSLFIGEITQLIVRVDDLRQRTTHLEAISISERGHVRLSKDDVRTVQKALKEWEGIMGVDDLSVTETSINWQRYHCIKARMKELVG